MVQITVRDVDKEVFREFKAAVTRQGVTIGTALSLAMEKYQHEVHLKKKISSWRPIAWGKGTEHISENVDAILYEKK